MATLQNGQQQTVTMVESHMSVTLTKPQKDDVVKGYAVEAAEDALEDVNSIIGNTRMVEYAGSSMTSTEKENTGADKIIDNFWSLYIGANSLVIHEGVSHNLIFNKGSVWHIPGANPNESDFEDIVNLIHRKIAEAYVDVNGNASQRTTATNYYTTKLATFS